MTEFDPVVFESIIEKVIIGEVDEQDNKNPYKITFVFKTGIYHRKLTLHRLRRRVGRAKRVVGA